MTSKAALALAIALPLAMVSIAFIIGSAILLFRLVNQRRESTRLDTALLNVQKQLAAFPRPGSEDPHQNEFFLDDISLAYGRFVAAVCQHVRKWIDLESTSSPPRKASVPRLQAILFLEPPRLVPINKGMDTALFSNSHQYTIEEICSAIEGRGTRHDMFQYILMSIMLKGVTLREDAVSTLLPFTPDDVRSLAKLHGQFESPTVFSGRVSCHIGNFWIYKSSPGLHGPTRSEYYKIVQSVFEPYFTTDADMFQYRSDLDDVLDKAIEFGKKVSGRAADHIETRWGKRDDVNGIVTYPALYAVECVKDGRFVDHCLDKGAIHGASEEVK